jgi:hypothetical protein
MTIKNQFAVNPDKRISIPEDARLDGITYQNNKGIDWKLMNTLLFERNSDHLFGTEAQVKLPSPRATFYTDGSGNALDKNDAAVTFQDDDRIVIVYDVALTANLLLDGQGKRLNLSTDRGYTLDLGGSYQLEVSNADNSNIDIKTNGTVANSLNDLTNNSYVKINNIYTNHLRRDLNLKIKNNSTNPDNQIDITFDYLTLYDTKGRGVVISKIIPLILDISTTGPGGLAASETETSSTWYFIYIYSDGSGVINGILSQESDWSNVVINGDNPVDAYYVRRLDAIFNNSTSNFRSFKRIDSMVYIDEVLLVSTTSTVLAPQDISGIIPPKIVKYIIGMSTTNTPNARSFTAIDLDGKGIEEHTYTSSGTSDRVVVRHDIETDQTIFVKVSVGQGNFYGSKYELRV